jgi:hypothetical protein
MLLKEDYDAISEIWKKWWDSFNTPDAISQEEKSRYYGARYHIYSEIKERIDIKGWGSFMEQKSYRT